MFKARRSFILPFPVVLLLLAACSSGGGAAGSNTVIIPHAPSGISQTVSSTPVQVVLTWSSSSVADHYRVYRSGYSGFIPSSSALIGVASQASYRDVSPSVVAGKVYYYRISTVSSSGYEGPSSDEIMVRLSVAGPPSSIITIGGDAHVTVAWSPVNGVSSYSLYRALASGGTATSSVRIASSLTGTTLFVDAVQPLVNGQKYFYALSSTNDFGEGALSQEIAATPMPASAPGWVTIQGIIRYEDREYDKARGLTGNTSLKPLRYADIEAVDAADPSLSAVASSATFTDGTYSLTLPAAMLGKNVYVQVVSSATIPSYPSGSQLISVMHRNRSLYGVNSPRFLLTANANVDLSVPSENQAAGAFNILDVLTTGFDFVNAMANPEPGLSLDAFWDQGNTIGTWYCFNSGLEVCSPSGEGIYVLNDPAGSGDTDEFDDDVIWHEFGHFVANKFSLDNSPGGVHYLNSNDLDLRLSWSEGWGDFFPGAVKSWLNADPVRRQQLSVAAGTPLSLYIDTSNLGSHLTIDIASPESSLFCNSGYYGTDSCKYASNEVAVANILWNLMSEPSFGMQPVWEIFSGYMPLIPADTQSTLESFWDGWLSLRNPGSGELLTLNTIYGDRLITYASDMFEADDTLTSSTSYSTGSPQAHTLYGDKNEDYVKFTPVVTASYAISTGDLRNGADTFLTLFDNAGTQLAANDNVNGIPYISGQNYDYYDSFTGEYVYPHNNTTNLSSKIEWTLTAGETYYVSVATSNNRPKSSGRYGSYTLTITSP